MSKDKNGDEKPLRERSKSVGSMPSNAAKPDEDAPGRPRSNSAPAVMTHPEKEPKKEFGAYHAKDWELLDEKVGGKTEKIDVGGAKAQGEAGAGVKAGADARFGVTNKGVVAEAGASAKAQAALKGKIEGRIADMNATGEGKLEVAAKAAAGVGASISRSGLKVEAGASAKASATTNAGGTLQVSDKQQVNGGVEGEAFAEAKASAEAKLSSEGVGTELDATAGAGAKVGFDLGGKEGDNSIKYSPRIVFGKVGAGVKGGLTHNNGKIGLDAKYTVNAVIGVEVNIKAEYSTEQISASGRKALEQFNNRQAAIDASTGNSFKEKTDGVVRVVKNGITVVSDYGGNLAEEGEKQGGVVGAIHVGSGTVIKYGGKAAEAVGGAIAEGGGCLVKKGGAIIEYVFSW